MSRSLNNKRCLLLLSALTAALLWFASAPTARAGVYTYNARQRTINAGVLFVGTASDPYALDPAPYVFYVLGQRPDVKPVGWNFINPLAQGTVTTAMSTRWAGSYKAGDSITPTMAAYWEVALRDVSADDLQQFDVLYLSASGANFLPSDNEKLRRFVDNGGQLIVEYGAAGSSYSLFDSATWTAGAATTSLLPPSAPSPGLLDLHPIITQPNFLAPADFPLLGAPSATGGYGTLTQNTNIFGAVLLQSGKDAVDAAQLGGGQVVMSALNIGPTVSISRGAFFTSGPYFAQAPYYLSSLPLGPYGVSVVPSVDLKFLSNAISWLDTHPTENKTSHQNAAGPSSASYTAAWAYPDPAQGTVLTSTAPAGVGPPAPAVSGDYVFVTDSTGVLHAFDAYPDQDLTVKGKADDQVPVYGSFPNQPTPYGEIWHTASPISSVVSGPTAFSFGGQSLVMVEDKTGAVYVFYAVTGTPWTTAKLNTANANGTFAGPVPAPTYYDGRVYAGQPDGTLFVFSLNGSGSAGGGALIPVNPQGASGSGEYVTASPAVGLLASGTVTNSIVALVPTTQNLNTVLLGARNDPLIGFSPGGTFEGYDVNRNARYSLPNLFVDAASLPVGKAYDSLGNLLGTAATGQGRGPAFPSTIQPINIDDQFGDWDIDLVKSIPQNGGMTLTLHEIKALSIAAPQGSGAILSAPAIDRHGDYYYTVNAGQYSYLFGVHDDIMQRNVRLKFRFRFPQPNDQSTVNPINGTQWSAAGNAIDADNVNYAGTGTNSDGSSQSLLGYHFVGAPVVDGQGNVYVAAQYGGSVAAVLCFNADQEVTAVPLGGAASGFDATQARYFQIDEDGGNPQDPLVAIPLPGRGAGRYGQITTAGGVASVFNFGRGSGGSRQIAGNLCEPQPFTAVPNPRANSNTSAMWMYFHTNLAWFATFAVNGQISGLSKSGSTLFLCDSGNGSAPNTLYKLPAAPTVGIGKLAALTVQRAPLGTGANGKYLSIGNVTAAPGAGGGAMVVNGTAGLAALNQQLTLIADNNRILEADADGNAVWSADATTRAGGNGVSTKLDFAHPSALSQFAPNDYLVADTGNNRCVRFDRAGNVLWELTRFYDPGGLMAPGQPFTLSQPASVEVRRYADTTNTNNAGGTMTSYLIADSGNDRIVEVTDTFDPLGNIYVDASGNRHDHLLSWVTHTGDKYGRRYHYAGASYLDIPSGSAAVADTISIFALVTNTRVAQPGAGGQLAPASADAPGGSIVAFNRPPSPMPFSALTNDLAYVATSFTASVTTGGPSPVTTTVTFPVRNPRYLHVFAPPQGTPTTAAPYAYSFLYADDNGAFDLVYQGLAKPPVSYGLAFTQADYRNMSLVYNIPADVQGNIPLRGGILGSFPASPSIPFVPTCVQRLNDDDTNMPGINHIDRYLITQSYSQGELARQPGLSQPGRLGGEIFEVDVSTLGTGSSTTVTQVPVGGFGGGSTGVGNPLVFNGPLVGFTLSRPVGASPLTQPTFAIRTTQ